jgi:16S rRNA (uracil1498-N3)-methyltransferase
MKTAQRLFVEAPLGPEVEAALDEGQSHYLANVLRLAPGAEALLFNGKDGEWTARIAALSRKGGAAVCVRQVRPQDRVPPLTLFFAPIKGDRLEAIVEKATELGAAEIVPVITERTIVRKVNLARLRARAVEAAEQTGRLSVPPVRDPVPLGELLAPVSDDLVVLFADEAGEAPALPTVLSPPPPRVALLTGPEGGFTPAERARLRACPHVRPVNLGPRILRADTAAFAGLSLIQSGWGDWR